MRGGVRSESLKTSFGGLGALNVNNWRCWSLFWYCCGCCGYCCGGGGGGGWWRGRGPGRHH